MTAHYTDHNRSKVSKRLFGLGAKDLIYKLASKGEVSYEDIAECVCDLQERTYLDSEQFSPAHWLNICEMVFDCSEKCLDKITLVFTALLPYVTEDRISYICPYLIPSYSQLTQNIKDGQRKIKLEGDIILKIELAEPAASDVEDGEFPEKDLDNYTVSVRSY